MLKFEKISRVQRERDLFALLLKFLSNTFENITIPTRATRNASGHDFVTPFAFNLAPGESIKIPTGIRMIADQQVWVLAMPRGGLGCKYWLQLDNTVGNVDGNYWESDIEGHVFAKITNDGKEGKVLELNAGDRFMQGVILPYLKTDDDDVQTLRNGGHGSTGK